MRDLVLAAVVFGSLPLILWRPHFGALMWVWIGMMNPHLLAYGFASRMPLAAIVATATLVGLVFTRKRQPFPVTPITVLLVVFFLWMCVTRIFAMNSAEAVNEMWGRVFKIQLMLWVTLMLIDGRRQIEQLIWAIVISIGFYGVKGGVWTLATGGGNRVWGPAGSFIGGNNELALALVVLIPLMYYLAKTARHRWVRHGLFFGIAACALAVLGSYSRGAFLAVGAMAVFLGVKSGKPVRVFLVIVIAALAMLAFMPETWWGRIGTLESYEEDASAMSRIHTWQTIWRLALDRPIFGAGFDLANPLLYQLYAPNPLAKAHAAHSIYFQALGEHGFVGLGLYLCLAVGTWRVAGNLAKASRSSETEAWVPLLMRMIQTSMVGFAVGGAFLGLLHFDLPYYLVALVVLAQRAVEKATAAGDTQKVSGAAPVLAGGLSR